MKIGYATNLLICFMQTSDHKKVLTGAQVANLHVCESKRIKFIF